LEMRVNRSRGGFALGEKRLVLAAVLLSKVGDLLE
jgi:hypothetical protein